MILTLVLLMFGLLCIYLEFFLPGGIMGIIGGLLTFSSVFVLLYLVKPSSLVVIGYTVFIIFLILIIIKLGLKTLMKRKNSFYLDTHQKGFVASLHQKDLYGKCGVAITDLRPSGHIEIMNESFQATSNGIYIKKGEKIKVIGGEGARLIVEKIGEKNNG